MTSPTGTSFTSGASVNGGVQLGSAGRNAKIVPVIEYFAPVPATIGKAAFFSH